ncbi:unnamed protein product [Rhodiola kirilowii]
MPPSSSPNSTAALASSTSLTPALLTSALPCLDRCCMKLVVES